jgi:hypothetical protein
MIDLSYIPSIAGMEFSPYSFSALEKLDIGIFPNLIADFLPRVTSRRLTETCLVLKHTNAAEIIRLAMAVKMSYSHSLRDIKIIWEHRNRNMVISNFSPLHLCHLLETFFCNVDGLSVIISDEDVGTMARSWPALKSFQILQRLNLDNPPPRGTFRGLQSFAEHCPRLALLAIAVDASTTSTYMIPSDRPSSSLETLVLQDSICGSVEYMTDFFDQNFPRLRRFHETQWVRRGDTGSAKVQSKWYEVRGRWRR